MNLNYLENDMFSKLSKNDLLELKKQLQTSKFYYRDSLEFSKYDTFGTEIEYDINVNIGSHILKGNYNYWRQFIKTYVLYEKELIVSLLVKIKNKEVILKTLLTQSLLYLRKHRLFK